MNLSVSSFGIQIVTETKVPRLNSRPINTKPIMIRAGDPAFHRYKVLADKLFPNDDYTLASVNCKAVNGILETQYSYVELKCSTD